MGRRGSVRPDWNGKAWQREAGLDGYGANWQGLAEPVWQGRATRVAAGLAWGCEARFGRQGTATQSEAM
jgi:hypothetical protein